ncbi:hypothetical protein D3C71_1535950 [compost metagenome]
MRAKIIPFLEHKLKHQEPKIKELDQQERMYYKGALGMLGLFIPENFFDLPALGDFSNRFSVEDGLYYEIPYFDSDQLWSYGNKRTLLVVLQIEKRSSIGVFRIEVEHTFLDNGDIDGKNFKIICYDQPVGQRHIPKEMIVRENGVFYTQIPGHGNMTLSQLMDFKSHPPIKA